MSDPVEQSQQPVAPQWAGRVPKWKIARLYEDDGKGIPDEELIDDIAYSLLVRCESMIMAAEAHRGHATCPVCSQIVEHNWDKKARLLCSGCGWTGQWEAYWRTFKGKRLKAGGLEPFCREYIKRLPPAETPRQKMLLVDWLIHRFHWEGRDGLPGRPGAVGLIGGTAREVDAFLDALTLDDSNHPQSQEEHQSWTDIRRQQYAASKVRQEATARGREEKRHRQDAKRKRRATKAQQRSGGDN